METIEVRNQAQLRGALMKLGLTIEPLPELPVEIDDHRIEWAKQGNIVNALKRLERAGDETSRTTEKLIAAAATLSEHIVAQLPEDVKTLVSNPDQHYWDKLPKDYYCDKRGTILLHWDPETEGHRSVSMNRSTALAFARDVADGWLDELAEWLEKRAAEDEAAAVSLAEKTDS